MTHRSFAVAVFLLGAAIVAVAWPRRRRRPHPYAYILAATPEERERIERRNQERITRNLLAEAGFLARGDAR
jgi:hypothetical protein